MMTHKISPSMMCADFLDLREVLDIFIDEGIDYLHIDIMDGHYVPNFGLSVDFCRAVHAYTRIPLDIHLMVDNPDDHVSSFAPFRGAVFGFHPETSLDPPETIRRVRNAGLRPALVLKPDIPLEKVKPFLNQIDLLNVLTVNPGYSGQPLVPGTIEKITEAAAWIAREDLPLEIEVDGNVSWKNLPVMLKAGATVFVAGTSSIFSSGGDLRAKLRRFRSLIEAHS